MINLDDLFSEEGATVTEDQPGAVETPTEEKPVVKAEPEPPAVEEEEEDDEEEEEESPSPDPIKATVSTLIKAGILQEDPGDVDEDTLAELIYEEQEAAIDEGIKNTFDQWTEKLPAPVMDLIKFTFNGGSADDFFAAVNEVPLASFDVTSETGQEVFMRYYLKSVEKMTEDEVEDRIEWLMDKGKLESESTKKFQNLAKDRDKRLSKLAEDKANAAALAKETARKEAETLQANLLKVEEIKGYKLSAGERKLLTRYITMPVTENGKTLSSGLIAELQDIFGKPEDLLLLAKLVKSKFNTDFLEAKTQTKVARKIRNKLNKQEPSAIDTDGVIWD